MTGSNDLSNGTVIITNCEKTMILDNLEKCKIGVIGLGYVGLPLALAFSAKYQVIGFDVNTTRIDELKNGIDSTLEVESRDLEIAQSIQFTSDLELLSVCDVFIVTVPTPIRKDKSPDLSPLKIASDAIGRVLSKGNIVIYESTVYPGATEEQCVPILCKVSGLNFNEDFFVGYSPERINPGDKLHTITKITKVTSGSTHEAALFVDKLYASIIEAGTHLAPSIKVAEAAKVIENTQRDLNIALVNELAILFNRLEIDTMEVLKAAGTKWNFLPFRPGLVGGHCIGVDPYYLTYKAQEVGYIPQVILAGRRLNDGMGSYVASNMIKAMIRKGTLISGARILVLGITFKENCPDLRNTRVVDVIKELEEYGAIVDVFDPWVNIENNELADDINFVPAPESGTYDGVIITVAHKVFFEMGIKKIKTFGKQECCTLYDLKNIFSSTLTDLRL